MALARRPQRPDPEIAAQKPQADARHLHHGQSRRVPGAVHRTPVRQRHARAAGDSCRGRRQTLSGAARSSGGRHRPHWPAARARGFAPVRMDPRFQSALQQAPATLRVRILVGGRILEVQGQDGRCLRLRFRDDDRTDGTQAERRGRDLRTHPPRRDQGHRRGPLFELRRLGGELHRARRGLCRQHYPIQLP